MTGVVCDTLTNLTIKHIIHNLQEFSDSNYDSLRFLPPEVKNKLLKACTVSPFYLNRGRGNLKHILSALLNSQTIAADITSINVDDNVLQTLVLAKNLQKLHLKPDENCISTEGFLNLFPYLHRLCDLSLRNSSAVEDNVLRCLANNCPNLTLLDFGGCRNITDDGIKSISKLQNITCLTVSYSQMSDRGISYLVNSSNGNTLKELQIHNCANITEDGLKEIANYCPNIEILVFHNCSATYLNISQTLQDLDLKKLKQINYTISW
ncbi:unnamed protein product [Acanthoscelides obtectus]|nr:unnamed protein product [Acanthoscelides obtectus]CAK1623814.1 Protein AMN1 homolog [Acanthoscelides obtectus]